MSLVTIQAGQLPHDAEFKERLGKGPIHPVNQEPSIFLYSSKTIFLTPSFCHHRSICQNGSRAEWFEISTPESVFSFNQNFNFVRKVVNSDQTFPVDQLSEEQTLIYESLVEKNNLDALDIYHLPTTYSGVLASAIERLNGKNNHYLARCLGGDIVDDVKGKLWGNLLEPKDNRKLALVNDVIDGEYVSKVTRIKLPPTARAVVAVTKTFKAVFSCIRSSREANQIAELAGFEGLYDYNNLVINRKARTLGMGGRPTDNFDTLPIIAHKGFNDQIDFMLASKTFEHINFMVTADHKNSLLAIQAN